MSKTPSDVSRRNFIARSSRAAGALAVMSLIGCRQKEPLAAAVSLKHSHGRYIDVTHLAWDLGWRMQLPEVVRCRAGLIQNWQQLDPQWTATASGGLRYVWESNDDYARAQLERHHPGAGNKPAYLSGVEVDATIEPTSDGFKTLIKLTNNTPAPLEDLFCEGGCLQARGNEPFTEQEHHEATLRDAMIDGRFVRMDELSRTLPVRCRYYSTDEEAEANSRFDFWGNSDARVDEPAVVGARSKDDTKFLAFAYEQSNSIWQNGDEWHHCVHSSMQLGRLEPGASVQRKAFVIFGHDLETCRRELLARIG